MGFPCVNTLVRAKFFYKSYYKKSSYSCLRNISLGEGRGEANNKMNIAQR